MSEVLTFSHAGATLVVGERGEGDPFYVVIHGIGMGRSVFTDLVDHLDDTAHIAAIDLPGYGDAPEPPRTLTMARNADLVAAYLREKGTAAVVIGHSMGTQVAVELAARHPELVDRLVLVGPTVDPAARTALRQLIRLARDVVDEGPAVIAAGLREYVRAGPNLRAKFRAMLVHEPERVYPRVRAPALVVRGENDVVAPRDWCRRVAQLLPHGELAEVADRGHEAMIRDAAPAVALIRDFVGER